MTTVYFVRHATPNYDNHDDFLRELSPKGLQDREKVTEFLLDKGVDVVLSSPFKRAVDTVKDFADKVGLEVVTIEDFRERKIDSVWIEDFTGFAKRQWSDFTYKLSDGESLGEVQARNIAALNQVLTQYANQTIVVGSHGTALSTIINYYYPTFGYEDFEKIRGVMPWIVRFTFDGRDVLSVTESVPCHGERPLSWHKRSAEAGRPPKQEGRPIQEIRTYDFLDRLGVTYTSVDHEAAMTMEDCAEIDQALGGCICKNLFLCNRQETDFYLLLLPGDKKFRAKDFSKQLGVARLSFADGKYMEEFLDITPGSLSVMGLMNDKDKRVRLCIDSEILQDEYISCHPCVNTSSIRFKISDLLDKVIPATGHEMTVVQLPRD